MTSIETLFEFLQQHAISLSMAYLHSVLPKLVEQYGLDQTLLLEQAGITESEWQQSTCFISFYKVAALFFQIWQRAKDPALGVRIGAATQVKSFQMLGYAVMSCDTIADALHCLTRYEKLAGKLGETHVRTAPHKNIIEWKNPLETDWAGFISDAAIAGWVGVARTLTTSINSPQRVFFKHTAPTDISFYQNFFNCPLEFNAAFDGIEISSEQLHAKIISADATLRDIIQREAELQLEKFDEHHNLINVVRAEIWKKLPTGEPRIERVAEALQLSQRNLQSRLKASGANFLSVADDVRHSAALYHLRDKTLPLLQVAFLLGFSEQSSFNRAFKRWTGVSPTEWREARMEGP